MQGRQRSIGYHQTLATLTTFCVEPFPSGALYSVNNEFNVDIAAVHIALHRLQEWIDQKPGNNTLSF